MNVLKCETDLRAAWGPSPQTCVRGQTLLSESSRLSSGRWLGPGSHQLAAGPLNTEQGVINRVVSAQGQVSVWCPTGTFMSQYFWWTYEVINTTTCYSDEHKYFDEKVYSIL